jgi:hypothetical protein
MTADVSVVLASSVVGTAISQIAVLAYFRIAELEEVEDLASAGSQTGEKRRRRASVERVDNLAVLVPPPVQTRAPACSAVLLRSCMAICPVWRSSDEGPRLVARWLTERRNIVRPPIWN